VKPERAVALAFGLSTLAGLGLAAVYLAGGQPQLEGALLFVSLGGLGAGLTLWVHRLMPSGVVTEPRRPSGSPAEDRRAMEESLERAETMGRRRFLTRMLLAAAGALGIAALFPIRSLGPSPGRSLLETSWRRGLRLVDRDGVPVRATDLVADSVTTVFPEGHVGEADAQTLLIKVDPQDLDLPPGREDWVPEGNLAYSKVCTHAGCPVGLYRAETSELLCPCHQSTFDVLRGAEPVFGPATRPLPQLPIEVDADGFLVASGGFSAPVGPGFWDLPEPDEEGD
jgi:ubiquinol-cytochrome c reductase iron-sulfur subunit